MIRLLFCFIFFSIFLGDHPATAKAIAKSVGILGHDQDPVERTALLKPAESCLITGIIAVFTRNVVYII